MRPLPVTLLAGSLLLLAACKATPKPDLPIYPDAQGMKGMGTINQPKVIAYNSRWLTPSPMDEVVTFYSNALLSRPGWTRTGDERERVIFSNGNIQEASRGLYWPIDETKPGASVEIVNEGNKVIFSLWQAFPLH